MMFCSLHDIAKVFRNGKYFTISGTKFEYMYQLLEVVLSDVYCYYVYVVIMCDYVYVIIMCDGFCKICNYVE